MEGGSASLEWSSSPKKRGNLKPDHQLQWSAPPSNRPATKPCHNYWYIVTGSSQWLTYYTNQTSNNRDSTTILSTFPFSIWWRWEKVVWRFDKTTEEDIWDLFYHTLLPKYSIVGTWWESVIHIRGENMRYYRISTLQPEEVTSRSLKSNLVSDKIKGTVIVYYNSITITITYNTGLNNSNTL